MVGVFFCLENNKHVGSCNIQCLNATVYKKYVKQNAKILGKYVEFCPHPKSLDGVNAPKTEELVRLGFNNSTPHWQIQYKLWRMAPPTTSPKPI